MALLLAAVTHDLDHPGTNNQFQADSRSELFRRYSEEDSDVPILETHHVTLARALIDDGRDTIEHCDVLESLNSDERERVHSMLKTLILSTDMAKHKQHLDGLIDDLRANGWPTNEALAIALLKAADISNLCRPFTIAGVWAEMLSEEFLLQGDKESELQISVPKIRSRRLSEGKSHQLSLGFMDFVAARFFEKLAARVPAKATVEMLANLRANGAQWRLMVETA